jgi:hypothetical protein
MTISWRDRINELRGLPMTYREIADQVGVSPQTLCDIARGRHSAPRGDAALRLDALHRARLKENKPRPRVRR